MLSELRVGPIRGAAGSVNPQRSDEEGAAVVVQAHGEYFDAARRGGLYHFAAQAALSLPASLVSTAPVFVLHNPAGSGKLLLLLDVIFAFSAAPAAAVVMALVGNINPEQAAPTSVTEGVVRSTLMPNNAVTAVGKIYTVATLGTAPIILRPIASIVGAAAITPPYIKDDAKGSIVIKEKGYVIMAASAAAAGFPYFSWEEVDA